MNASSSIFHHLLFGLVGADVFLRLRGQHQGTLAALAATFALALLLDLARISVTKGIAQRLARARQIYEEAHEHTPTLKWHVCTRASNEGCTEPKGEVPCFVDS